MSDDIICHGEPCEECGKIGCPESAGFQGRLVAHCERMEDALAEIADAPALTWRPVQIFRSDQDVAPDEAAHEAMTKAADIARSALGLAPWGSLEQIKQGTARENLSRARNG